jgi:lipopolysaccharide transport protein LptA
VTFINNVVVEKEDSSLLAQKMVVIYEENSQKKSEIKKIEAFNDVKIFSQDFIANSQYGYYDPKKSIFVLEKKVIVNNGTSIASGEKFIYDIKTKKGNFVGQRQEESIKKRVTVIIGNDIKEQKKSKKIKDE